jgi:hypothetical protein
MRRRLRHPAAALIGAIGDFGPARLRTLAKGLHPA